MVVGKGRGYTSVCNHCSLDDPGEGPGNVLWETFLTHSSYLQGENETKQKLEVNDFIATFLVGNVGSGVGTLVSCKEQQDQKYVLRNMTMFQVAGHGTFTEQDSTGIVFQMFCGTHGWSFLCPLI